MGWKISIGGHTIAKGSTPNVGHELSNFAGGVKDAVGGFFGGVGNLASHLIADVIGYDLNPDIPTNNPLLEKLGSNNKLPVIYGQQRVGGILVYMATTGDNNKYLWLVYALCEGEIESIDEIWIDDVRITDSSFGSKVTVYTDPAILRTRYGFVGTDDQAACAELVSAFTDWTSADQGRKVAYVPIRLEYDEKVFKGGSQPTIQFDVRGKRMLDVSITSTTLDGTEAAAQTTLSVAATSMLDSIVTAGSFVHGLLYTIISAGTTSFTGIGAADNNPGTMFRATGAGSGTGTAWPLGAHAFIELDDGTLFDSTIVSIDAGNTITINDGLPSQATSGNAVYFGGYSVNNATALCDMMINQIYGQGLDIGADINTTDFASAITNCATKMNSRTSMPSGYLVNQTDHALGDYFVTLDTGSNAPQKGDSFFKDNDSTEYLILSVSGTGPDYTLEYIPGARTVFSNNEALDFQINYFAVGGVLPAERTIFENVKTLLQSFDGMMPFDGQYNLLMRGFDDTPVYTIDTSMIKGGIQFEPLAKTYKKNKITGKFSNPDNRWNTDVYVAEDATYRSNDGVELSDNITMPLENNYYRAGHRCETALKVSRDDINVSIVGPLELIYIQAGNVVKLTYPRAGWTEKYFRALQIAITSMGVVSMGCQEHTDANYSRTVPAAQIATTDTNLPNPFYSLIEGSDVQLRLSNWFEKSNPSTYSLIGIVYGDQFVAVGAADGTDALIVTSLNGSDAWSEISNPKAFDLNAVTWDGTKYIAVGAADGTDAYIVNATDPTGTWTERSNPSNTPLVAIASGNGVSIAVGTTSGGDAYLIKTTDNGDTWAEKSNPKNFHLRDIAYNNDLGRWIAVGDNDGTDGYMIYSDDDGDTWYELANPSTNDFNSIAYGNGRWVAVYLESGGSQEYIWSDDNGDSWNSVSNSDYGVNRVIFADGAFVAVGGSVGSYSGILISIDGSIWAAKAAPAYFIGGIGYSSAWNVFALVGHTGTQSVIMTSLYGR